MLASTPTPAITFLLSTEKEGQGGGGRGMQGFMRLQVLYDPFSHNLTMSTSSKLFCIPHPLLTTHTTHTSFPPTKKQSLKSPTGSTLFPHLHQSFLSPHPPSSSPCYCSTPPPHPLYQQSLQHLCHPHVRHSHFFRTSRPALPHVLSTRIP